MSVTAKRPFSRIFPALMLFCLLVWVWTVALIVAWPWEKTGSWKPDTRLPVVCADGQMCSIAYGQLAEALGEKKISAVRPAEPVGEIADPDAYVRWKTVSDQPWQYEASASSWHFETTVRYRINENTPELLQYRHYDGSIFFYALPAALFTLIGIYLRKLRS